MQQCQTPLMLLPYWKIFYQQQRKTWVHYQVMGRLPQPLHRLPPWHLPPPPNGSVNAPLRKQPSASAQSIRGLGARCPMTGSDTRYPSPAKSATSQTIRPATPGLANMTGRSNSGVRCTR